MLSTGATYGERYHGEIDGSVSLTANRSARRGPWLTEEDQALLQLVRTQGANNWVRISQQLQHRSPKQCRERYHQNLKPSLKHDPISAQEGELIERLVREMGKRWAEIARRLGNRSDNAVKNWWNGSVNRRKRNPPQSSTGFKQMGSRLQPVPFTLPRNSAYQERSQSTLSARNSTSISAYDTLRETVPLHGQDVHQIPVLSPTYTLSTNGILSQTSFDPNASSSLPSISTSGSATKDSRPSLPKVHTSDCRPELPPLRSSSFHLYHSDRLSMTAERPPISPALSDTSQRHAPSLVSDNQSMYSISPRTVSTPRPGLPAPIEIVNPVWSDNQMTTLHNYHSTPHSTSCRPDSHVRYVGPVPFDSALRRYSISNTSEDRSKDSRMNVSTLLQ